MKLKTTSSFALVALAISGGAFAQTATPAAAPAAPEPEYTISPNLTFATDYRYRGVSQTSRKPVIQAGVDYTNKNGFYASTLIQNVSWIKNGSNPTVAKGPLEWDFWGGYKGEIAKDVAYDIGALYYWYTGNTNTANGYANANTLEAYGALTYGITTVKYSHALSNVFGNPSSKGSGYLEAAATFDLGEGFSLTPHLGYQTYKNNTSIPKYTDYALTLNKDYAGVTFGAAFIGTNKGGNAAAIEAGSSKDIYKSSLVLSINKKF